MLLLDASAILNVKMNTNTALVRTTAAGRSRINYGYVEGVLIGALDHLLYTAEYRFYQHHLGNFSQLIHVKLSSSG